MTITELVWQLLYEGMCGGVRKKSRASQGGVGVHFCSHGFGERRKTGVLAEGQVC